MKVMSSPQEDESEDEFVENLDVNVPDSSDFISSGLNLFPN
jgi:hypothetical protein